MIPEINKSNEGMRLVIDLPNTNMSVADKVVPIKNKDLSEMRLNLVAATPPRVHVEVDFRMPLSYTWNATGNRLLITFREPGKPDTPATPATGATSPARCLFPPQSMLPTLPTSLRRNALLRDIP